MAAATHGAPVRLLTSDEAARDVLRCSTKTLARLVKNGEIAVTRVGTRSIRFSSKVLEEFIERQTAS